MIFNNPQKQMEKREDYVMDKQMYSADKQNIVANEMSPQSQMIDIQERKEMEDLVRWQQDLEPEVEQLDHDLKKEVFNSVKGVWEPKLIGGLPAEPMCNDYCVLMIKTAIRPFMTKNEMMSNYSEEQIYTKLKATMKTIIRNIGLRHHYYEISFHDISVIRQTIQNAIMSSPFRALKQGERDYIKGSKKMIETVTHGNPMQQQRGGLMQGFRKIPGF